MFSRYRVINMPLVAVDEEAATTRRYSQKEIVFCFRKDIQSRFGGICGVRSVENAECGKCAVQKMRSVENEECGK